MREGVLSDKVIELHSPKQLHHRPNQEEHKHNRVVMDSLHWCQRDEQDEEPSSNLK